MRKHLEGIERELNTADGWGKVRFHVRVLTSQTQRLLLGHGHWENSQVNTKDDFLSILLSEQVEAVVVAAELNLCARRHLFLEESVVVLLVQNHRLLSQAYILEELFKVKRPFANVIIGLEQVKVPSLHHEKKGVLARGLDIEHNSIVPGTLAARAPEVSIGILLVVIIHIGPDEDIRDTFEVLTRHILGVHD